MDRLSTFFQMNWGATRIEHVPSRDKLYCYGIKEHNIKYVDGEHWQSGVAVPEELRKTVDAISVLWSKPSFGRMEFKDPKPTASEQTSPTLGEEGSPNNIRKSMGIPSSFVGSSKNTQMVWGPGTYGVLKTDVEKYIKHFNVKETIAVIHQVGNKGKPGGDNFGEATLDTEVITGIAPGVTTYVANTNKTSPTEEGPGFGWAFMDFLSTITSWDDGERVNVLSISLGSLAYESCHMLCESVVKMSAGKYTYKQCTHYLQYEQRQVCQYANDYVVTRASTEMMKLGTLGVTVVGAAGDGGCHYSFHPFEGNPMADYLNKASCASILPVFPCASPWMTCVGGTQWPMLEGSKNAKLWHGGGSGFSRNFPMPKWQKTAVEAYIKAYNNTPNFAPYGSYNHTARAYPDVSALADGVLIVMFGSVFPAGGTSASTPAVGGFFSMVNEDRLKKGKPLLGHVAPLLYQLGAKSPSAYHDITEGNSRCPSGGQCCQNGFPAKKGWDAATGWGRPLWDAFVSN
eukprot:TRINITY_DN61878_c0_g1_i1.p1 TRINITY_DN61878_c0_g1~~TRINITY_DN61878_c0_g1_i1.p1  ORF type:complete len:593 (-),score=61.12 TRINITY_DN61878_c0_g1_i1:31-1572(-)